MKNKLIIIMTFISIFNVFIVKDVSAKYVQTNVQNIFKIQSADNIFPEINGRNYNVYDEKFNTDIKINFSDNIGIKHAKYWFSEENNIFGENEGGIDFTSGTTFEKSGYYKIEVEDLYNNKVQYTFVIDKEVNKSEINFVSENENQINLKIDMQDIVSGIQKAEVYLDGKIYRTYDYTDDNLKNIFEEIIFLKNDVNFYEEIYVNCIDFFGNSKKSESLILNQDKIYDVEDLYRFTNIVNNNICDFSGKMVYLMNNLNLNTEKWNSIIDFKGEFDGKNHTISGLYMDTNSPKSGFFKTNYGIIKNLTVIGEIHSTSDISAGICGENFGKIENCRSKVTINSFGNYVGGIAGINYGYIEKCRNNYNISTIANYAGGIVGYNKNNGIISKCGSSGNITSKVYSGGICGFAEGAENKNVVELSFNMGTIKAESYVGGICGGTSNETIEMNHLYNRGNIIEIGNNGNNGGIVGENKANIYIKNLYNIGNIESLKPNQIAPANVSVEEAFYISGKSNNSNNGNAKDEYLFKELISNKESILYLLSENTSNIWDIRYGYNDGYPMFLWEFE